MCVGAERRPGCALLTAPLTLSSRCECVTEHRILTESFVHTHPEVELVNRGNLRPQYLLLRLLLLCLQPATDANVGANTARTHVVTRERASCGPVTSEAHIGLVWARRKIK
ncbi:unnamed protein product [Pleuronectes platessa]|uniref:Uncharacterized protein n=1 Tax=Pleuronectes platessa TaxID=8262 RepID=A0A9N7TNH3_PLEPL|nr:unnamed protein product [Pleuronectes platessa]